LEVTWNLQFVRGGTPRIQK